jgi:hypothetical protein
MSFKTKKYVLAFSVAVVGCFLIDDVKTILGVIALIASVNIEKMKESDYE